MNSKKKVPDTWKKEIKKGFKAALKTAAKHDGSKRFLIFHKSDIKILSRHIGFSIV